MRSGEKIYHDFYFRIVLALIGGHLIVMYNDPHSFFEVVFRWPYLRAMIGSVTIALLLIQYIFYITVKLDRRYDWHDQTLQRLFWQTVLGFLSPALFAFMLAAFFFWLFKINILNTTYLSQDYTIIIIMLLVVNLYFFGLYSFFRLKEIKDNRSETQSTNVDTISPESGSNLKGNKSILIINTATKSIPVRTNQIAYFYILKGIVFLRTFEMESISESYQLTDTLKAVEEQLDKREFLRINRQMIVNFNAVTSYKPGRNKSLDIIISPTAYNEGANIPAEHLRLTIVSEDRAAAFKAWMNR